MSAPLPTVLNSQFLGGERRCPPADCGGVLGYYDFLENIASKEIAKRKGRTRLVRRADDPDHIDQQKVVAALRKIATRRTKR
jgi:hypothetical protein